MLLLVTKVQFRIAFPVLFFRPSNRAQGAPEDLARRELEERERKVIEETFCFFKKRLTVINTQYMTNRENTRWYTGYLSAK